MEEGIKAGDDEIQGSSLTMEKVAAAKQFIENHYKTQMKNIQERKERSHFFHKLLIFTSTPSLDFNTLYLGFVYYAFVYGFLLLIVES